MDCYRAASQELKRRIEETNITAERKRKDIRDRFPQLALLEDEIREAGLSVVKSRVMPGEKEAFLRNEADLTALRQKKKYFCGKMISMTSTKDLPIIALSAGIRDTCCRKDGRCGAAVLIKYL